MKLLGPCVGGGGGVFSGPWGLFLCVPNISICTTRVSANTEAVFKVLGSTVGLSSNPVVLGIPCGFGQVTQSLCGSVSQLEKWG